MRTFITSIITILTFSGLHANNPSSIPKLVIGITIDQLRTDYLEAFFSLYGEKGFKRLWKDGRVYINSEYTFINVDKASSVAAVYSGASPHFNGIIGERWMERTTLIPTNCVEDKSYMGIYTDETTSATHLMTSTITDELKVSTQGKGLVYSIAPDREQAILAAGHAANGAYWLNSNTGKWCGTTYYDEFPYWLTRYNDQKGLDFRIGAYTWVPQYPITDYKFLTSEWSKDPFKYHFDDYKKNKFRKFKTSPFINEEVNLLAAECLYNTQMGMDEIPDMLLLNYYAGTYEHKTILESAVELQDIYVRLDQCIADILDVVDKKVGLKDVVFFITSTGYTDAEGPDLSKYRIPGGEFHINRCAALLNMYLMALYGEGQYVEAYQGLEIYLNHKLLEQKELNLPEILNKSADFLIQFSGVNEVYTSYRLLLGAWTPEIYRVRNSYNRKRSGDLIMEILPGWTVMDENPYGNHKVVRKSYIPFPLIFVGGQTNPEVIHTPVNIDCIAPTITNLIKIRAPNASQKQPLSDVWR